MHHCSTDLFGFHTVSDGVQHGGTATRRCVRDVVTTKLVGEEGENAGMSTIIKMMLWWERRC